MGKFKSAVADFVSRLFPDGKRQYLPVLKMLAILIVLISILIVVPYVMQRIIIDVKLSSSDQITLDSTQVKNAKIKLEKEIAILSKKLEAKMPKSYYLIINTASNEFSLYKGKELVRTDKCSTGSYVLLKQGDKQEWMFKTPKGEFKILGKTTSPVWKKPDWAFVEEGLPIPSSNHPSRYEYGVLGDYSLNLGQGYLIHGTLYQRFLGLPVTHGCIRLNDENLELIYNSMSIGSKVYIY
jgi:L,D-transpeptidase YbiS